VEERFEVAADPARQRAFAEDGPIEHGPAVDLLDEAGELGGVAWH